MCVFVCVVDIRSTAMMFVFILVCLCVCVCVCVCFASQHAYFTLYMIDINSRHQALSMDNIIADS